MPREGAKGDDGEAQEACLNMELEGELYCGRDPRETMGEAQARQKMEPAGESRESKGTVKTSAGKTLDDA